MAVTAEQMHAQIQNQMEALGKMSAKEREQNPSKQFADNYNNQLELSKEAMLDLDHRRWPPTVEIHQPSAGQPSAKAKYIEFHTYFAQILAILAEGIESGYGGLMG